APLTSRAPSVAINVLTETSAGDEPLRRSKPVGIGGGRLKVVHQVNPAYPAEAKSKGIQCKVIAEIEVDERGQVMEARIIEGHDALNAGVLDSVRQWRFSPYQLDGKAVPVKVRWTFDFSLS